MTEPLFRVGQVLWFLPDPAEVDAGIVEVVEMADAQVYAVRYCDDKTRPVVQAYEDELDEVTFRTSV